MLYAVAYAAHIKLGDVPGKGTLRVEALCLGYVLESENRFVSQCVTQYTTVAMLGYCLRQCSR